MLVFLMMIVKCIILLDTMVDLPETGVHQCFKIHLLGKDQDPGPLEDHPMFKEAYLGGRVL